MRQYDPDCYADGCLTIRQAPGQAESLTLSRIGTFASAKVGSAAIAGSLYGGILTPVRSDESFLGGRLRNAAVLSATFATMTYAGGQLKQMGVRSDVIAGVGAGALGGTVHAEAHSLLSGRGLPTRRELLESAYGFAMTGGVLGLTQKALGKGPTERGYF